MIDQVASEKQRQFGKHIDTTMRYMSNELRRGGAPANIMLYLAKKEAELEKMCAEARPNEPCPCGSGKKIKKYHGV